MLNFDKCIVQKSAIMPETKTKDISHNHLFVYKYWPSFTVSILADALVIAMRMLGINQYGILANQCIRPPQYQGHCSANKTCAI